MEDRIVELHLNQLKPNMILAKDAVNARGLNILAKNTKLTVDAFERLRRNKVKSVVVWGRSIEPAAEAFMESMRKSMIPADSDNPIIKKEEFVKFTKEYEKKISAFRNCLEIIKKGHYMDTSTLYTIVDGIVSVAVCKSDLLSYVCYLDDLDETTYTHCINVSIYCNIFGKWLNLDDEEIKEVSIAGLLHDVGKHSLSKDAIENEANPTEEQMEEIKKHPEYGCELVEKMKLNNRIKNGILYHHERIDGSGYPYGLRGESIPSYAKIVAICDVYDNLVTKKKITPFAAIRQFEEENLALLDTEYLLKFIRNILYVYTGSWAKLSDGRTCQIMFINNKFADRPIVKTENDIIDLVENKELSIVSMI